MALEYGYFDSEITGYDEEGMPILDHQPVPCTWRMRAVPQ